MQTQRIGVLTGGGDCPGLNAVVRAVVKSAESLDWCVVGIPDGFEGLIYADRVRELTSESVRGILPRGGTILGTTNRCDPFSFIVEIGGQRERVDYSQRVLDNARELGLDALIVIGGDGTLKIAHELAALDLRVVGVPKTIDNDLSATDVTFGFDTALTTATDALDKLHTTAESHHRVMVLEVMGRHAGWIGLHSGIAGGADVILIPEIPFRVERVLDKIAARDLANRHFTIVVASEGACPVGGNVKTQQQRHPDDPVRLGGIGIWLAEELAERTHHEVRATVLGHLQRGGSPTPFDRILGTRYGAAAVEALARGETDTMVALHGQSVESVTLAEAVGREKRVDPDTELVRATRKLGISLGDGY